MERSSSNNSGAERNRSRLWRVRQAGQFVARMLRGGRRSGAEAETPPASGERKPPEYRQGKWIIKDPHPDNYAWYVAHSLYRPEDDPRLVRDRDEFSEWWDRYYAEGKTRQERLAEIEASDPGADLAWLPDPETRDMCLYTNTPNGVAPVLAQRYSASSKHFVRDPNTGVIYEQLPDGSRLDIVQVTMSSNNAQVFIVSPPPPPPDMGN